MAGTPTAWANFGVGSWIERRARIAPEKLALVGDDRSLTYAELAGRVRRLANGLRRLGWGAATGWPGWDPTIRRSWRPCSPLGWWGRPWRR